MMKRAGLLMTLLACATDIKTTEPRDPREQPMQPITLTAGAPQHELAISAFSGSSPATLMVTIAAIDNPTSQAFSVGAGVTWGGVDARPDARPDTRSLDREIGSITPFPASQPGRFVLSVPEASRELIGRSEGRLILRLSLQPLAPDRPLAEPLKVTIGDLVWR